MAQSNKLILTANGIVRSVTTAPLDQIVLAPGESVIDTGSAEAPKYEGFPKVVVDKGVITFVQATEQEIVDSRADLYGREAQRQKEVLADKEAKRLAAVAATETAVAQNPSDPFFPAILDFLKSLGNA